MHLLLSNDDGVDAPGLQAMAEALQGLGKIDVVAPDRNRSGASHSLTLGRPLHAQERPNGYTAVDGTPTDCVHMAISGFLDTEPDMVVSGINCGANMGDDVHYSGTVAAAMEGRFLGYPAIAVSIASFEPNHYKAAAKITRRLLEHLLAAPLPADTILNINIPDLPESEIRGWQSTRLGNRHKSEAMIKTNDPYGRPCYWVGPAGPEQDAGPGTDFHAVAQGYVSVTPLRVDMTNHESLEAISHWLQTCSNQ